MFLFGDDWLLQAFLLLIPLWLSLSVHEWAHAWSAGVLGDDTATLLGRATLNPLAHIDPVGTLLLPLLGVPFGWAKPVPINPLRFRRDVGLRTGILLTAAAGPASNMVLAIGGAVLLAAVARLWPGLVSPEQGVLPLFQSWIMLNVALAFFNLLPIPPLDGSRVVDTLLPDEWRGAWDALSRFSGVALLAVLVGPALVGINLFAWPMEWAERTVQLALP
jgi:Zn-dependent protease